MAYATGSATTCNDLISAIRDFASLQGWTIAKTAANLLFLNKSTCFVAMQAFSYNYNDFATGVSVSMPDTRLEMSLSTSFTVALNNYYGHPGSLCTAANDTDRVATNMLQGPFTEYHLFSGAVGEPDYIIVSVKTGADTWRQFGFGMIDKGAFTHSGAAWLAGGNCGYFYRQSSSTLTSQYYNDVDSCPYPFLEASNVMPNTNTKARQLYAPDAMPNTANWPAMRADLMIPGINTSYDPYVQWPGLSSGRMLSALNGSKTSDYGGYAMLWPVPIIPYSSADSKSCYIGDLPGVRGVNMEGLVSGQEIMLGADTWKIFSIGRQAGWGTQTQLGFQYSTGHYGLAFKKNV